jgi:hypothetical protein
MDTDSQERRTISEVCQSKEVFAVRFTESLAIGFVIMLLAYGGMFMGWALNDTSMFGIFKGVMVFGGLFMILGAPTTYALERIYNKLFPSKIVVKESE